MNIFGKAYAQSIDEIASPTIPFEPPATNPTPVPTTTVEPTLSGPSIILTADRDQMTAGGTAKIEISINTQGIDISQFTIQITFDPNLIEVLDSDPTIPNTQIKYENTFFLETENSVSQPTGVINLSAQSDQGTTTISGTKVAEFEVKSLADGFTNLSIVKDNSNLLDANSTDILQSINSVSFIISDTGNEPLPGDPTIQPSKGTPEGFPSKTPDTALTDNLGLTGTLSLGAILIISGAIILRYRKNARIR